MISKVCMSMLVFSLLELCSVRLHIHIASFITKTKEKLNFCFSFLLKLNEWDDVCSYMLIKIYCKSWRLDIIFPNFLKKSKYIALTFINSVLFSICTFLPMSKSSLLFSKLSLYPDSFRELWLKSWSTDSLYEKLTFSILTILSSVS